MNIYEMTKKEMNAIEKDFSKTVFGQKVRLPVLLSLMTMVIWIITTVGMLFVQYKCMCWCISNPASCRDISTYYGCFTGFFDFITPCIISFVIIVGICIYSASNYNKELRKYISSK